MTEANDTRSEAQPGSAAAGAPKLSTTAARGALVTFSSQILRMTCQLLGISVLARLLSPSEYGVMALAVAFIGFGEVVRDFGLSSAAVQAESLTKNQRSNLFWMNLTIGSTLAVIAIATAPLVGMFYKSPDLQPVMQVLALTFIINGASAQYNAHLQRDLRFKTLAITGTTGTLISLVVGILAAFNGMGVWALVLQQLTLIAVPLVGMVVATRWIPSAPSRGTNMKPLISYGGNLMGAQLINYLSRNTDSLIIGRTAGSVALGFYDRAFQMLMLPLNQLNAPSTSIALPVLSRLRKDNKQFELYVLRGQTVMATIVSFTFAVLGAQASDVVRIFLGPGWHETSNLFEILCFAGMFQAVSYATYWIFLARGLTGSNMRFALISRPIVIAIIALGSFWGVYGVAAAYTAGLLFNWLFGLWWIDRVTDAPAAAMLRQGMRSILCSTFAGVIAFAVSIRLAHEPLAIRVSITTGVFIISTAILAVLVKPLRTDLTVCYRFGRTSVPFKSRKSRIAAASADAR